LLQDFHIKLAFVSCAGFTPEAGLTESDIRVAQLKSEMIAAASTVIALIDSSKFGKAYLAPFARTDQVARIFSDSGLAPGWIAQLQQTCAGLTVCDENSVAAFTPCAQEARHHVIGFANLSEQVPFAVEVRRSLERAAKEAGNIDLILADNQLDGDVALAVADRLIAAQPDLVIEYQIEERQNAVLMEKFRRANIPVIAVDIPMIGATYFGADNYRAGHMAGVALGQWIKEHWDGALDWLIAMEEPRAGAVPASRIQGQLDGLEEIIGRQEPETIARLNCGNTSEVSEAVMAAALVAHPHARRIAVISFNDDSALGALSAARRLGRDQDVIMTGQGADRSLREELNKPRSRIIGSTTFHPEQYGGQLIPLALKILRGEPVPPALHIEHTFIPAAHNLLANPLSGDA
jgi:ribose transport system substrate-binding protein